MTKENIEEINNLNSQIKEKNQRNSKFENNYNNLGKEISEIKTKK